MERKYSLTKTTNGKFYYYMIKNGKKKRIAEILVPDSIKESLLGEDRTSMNDSIGGDVDDIKNRHDLSILTGMKVAEAKTKIKKWHPSIDIEIIPTSNPSRFEEEDHRSNNIRLLVNKNKVVMASYN